MDVRKEAEVGDLKYIAHVNTRNDFDGYFLGMLRYRRDRSIRHVVESHYWTPDGQ